MRVAWEGSWVVVVTKITMCLEFMLVDSFGLVLYEFVYMIGREELCVLGQVFVPWVL